MSIRIGALRAAPGASRDRKRRGKGAATGVGGTSGRGHKGHKARTGGRIPSTFEGGQMPLQRRLPKRGFKNHARVVYEVVNLERLARFAAGSVVDRTALCEAGLVSRRGAPVKLLGRGEIKAALTLRVDAASESARKAVEAAGGRVEITRAAGRV
jgi:large subunit ribosomal protein L15